MCIRDSGVEASHSFALPQDWLRLCPTCHHNDPALFPLTQRFLDEDGPAPALFYLWGHSYEFEEDGNWARMEEFLQLAGGRPEVWYATNLEVYRYVTAFRLSLIHI